MLGCGCCSARTQVVPRLSGDDSPGPNTRCPSSLTLAALYKCQHDSCYVCHPALQQLSTSHLPATQYYMSRYLLPQLLYVSLCTLPYTLYRADSSSVFRPSILMVKHWHASSGRSSEPKQASQPTTSSVPRPLSRTSPTPAPQPALGPEGLTSEQQSEKKPVRTRVPAVTSNARTTAPEKDNSRRNRRKYPG